jgi:hypothetical protein
LHIQHAILLGPIIQQAIADEREKDRSRLATLLVQNTVLTGQVKYLLEADPEWDRKDLSD